MWSVLGVHRQCGFPQATGGWNSDDQPGSSWTVLPSLSFSHSLGSIRCCDEKKFCGIPAPPPFSLFVLALHAHPLIFFLSCHISLFSPVCCIHMSRKSTVITIVSCFSWHLILYAHSGAATRVITFFFTLSLSCCVKKSKVWSHAVCVQSVWCLCVCVCGIDARQISGVNVFRNAHSSQFHAL